MTTIANGIRPEFFGEINMGTVDLIDATELIPAGAAFGGDALVYTGHAVVKRDGYHAQSEIDAFGALFGI